MWIIKVIAGNGHNGLTLQFKNLQSMFDFIDSNGVMDFNCRWSNN